MSSLLDRFATLVVDGADHDFCRRALDVATAVAGASRGALLLRRQETLQVLASTLDAGALRTMEGLVESGNDVGAQTTNEKLDLLSFGAGCATGILCLEGARDPQAARRVADLLGRRLSPLPDRLLVSP